ncbi:MAG: DUF664 domain-containing protein, partial [Nostocoides sp.]
MHDLQPAIPAHPGASYPRTAYERHWRAWQYCDRQGETIPSLAKGFAMSEQERTDLIEALNRHRGFLLTTAEGLTEEQARTASTVSALTIGALLKHVADTEEQWMAFAV